MTQRTIVAEFWATVLEVAVAAGQAVAPGQALMVLESMKTEIPLTAASAGTVIRLLAAAGDTVEEGQALLVLEV